LIIPLVVIKIVLEEPLLYNLNIDPSEKYDIVYKNPDILEKINPILGGAQKNLIPTKDLLIERGLELLERGGE
jgi:arylsulfatase A